MQAKPGTLPDPVGVKTAVGDRVTAFLPSELLTLLGESGDPGDLAQDEYVREELYSHMLHHVALRSTLADVYLYEVHHISSHFAPP